MIAIKVGNWLIKLSNSTTYIILLSALYPNIKTNIFCWYWYNLCSLLSLFISFVGWVIVYYSCLSNPWAYHSKLSILHNWHNYVHHPLEFCVILPAETKIHCALNLLLFMLMKHLSQLIMASNDMSLTAMLSCVV